MTEELQQEMELRQTLSSHVHTLIDVLIGSNNDLPCCGWYLRNLLDVWKKESKDKSHKVSAQEIFRVVTVVFRDWHRKLFIFSRIVKL